MTMNAEKKDFDNDGVDENGAFLDCTDEFNNLGTLNPATGAIEEAQKLAASYEIDTNISDSSIPADIINEYKQELLSGIADFDRQKIAIIGKNGIGKSTLIKTLMKIIPLMKRFVTLFLIVVASVTAFAQLNGNGFYRVQNVGTKRYIYVRDNTGRINVQTTSADMGAIQLWSEHDSTISDPSSVIYICKVGSAYDLKSQGTGVHDIIKYYVTIYPKPDNKYQVYSEGLYLSDGEQANRAKGALDTGGKGDYRNWYIYPMNTTNEYFGVLPTVEVNGKHYAPFFADFAFTFASEGMKAYYINKVDNGQAVLAEVTTETVPASMPVLIECSSAAPADNKLNLLVSSDKKASDNLLAGVYFNNDKRPRSADARKAFPQGVREDMGTEGFALTQDKLGLSLYSGYATAEEKAAIKRVYLMPTAQDSTMAMIHWKTPAEYEDGLRELGRDASCTRGAGVCTLPDVYYSIEYISRNPMVSWRAYEQEDGSVLIMWLRSTGTSEDSILLCEWRKAEDAVEFTGKEVNPNGNVPLSEAFEQNPDGTGEPVKPEKDNASLSEFLMEDMTLAPTSDSNVKDELLKMQNEEDKRALLTDLIDYSLNSSGRVAAATNSEIYRGLAEETAGQIAIGKAEKDAVSKLEEKQREYDAILIEKELSLIELEKKILTETGKTAEELDTQTVFLVVNPEDLNPEELGKVILSQTRKASGVPFVSSGPGATETEEDPALEPIMQDLSFEMRILNALYKNIGISRAELTEAKQQAEEAGEAMITGSGTQEAFALATAQLNDKQAALIADCAEFTKEMIILDRMTGGYISEKYQWFKETMPEIPVAENQFGVEGGG